MFCDFIQLLYFLLWNLIGGRAAQTQQEWFFLSFLFFFYICALLYPSWWVGEHCCSRVYIFCIFFFMSLYFAFVNWFIFVFFPVLLCILSLSAGWLTGEHCSSKVYRSNLPFSVFLLSDQRTASPLSSYYCCIWKNIFRPNMHHENIILLYMKTFLDQICIMRT